MTSKKLQVWWIPQVPGKRFSVDVRNPIEAMKILDVLADYDKFQFDNNIKPDYSNAGGLIEWDPTTDEWLDWEDGEGRSIDEVMSERIEEPAS